jgi:RNA polymerase sigma-70 factor (ECF subfamily)
VPDFAALFEAEVGYVHHALVRLGVRGADVEDLTHDVFVAVHAALPRFDASRPVRPWLFGIAFRVASDHRRRARHTREVGDERADHADGAPPADEQLAAAETRALVLRALDALDLDRRAVLVMHDIDGCPAPEIAEALAVPLNTVYSRIRLARADFKAAVRRLRARGEP